MSIDDVVALTGLLVFLSGVYLWLGIPATLIIAGLVLMYIGARIKVPQRIKGNEPNQAANTTVL